MCAFIRRNKSIQFNMSFKIKKEQLHLSTILLNNVYLVSDKCSICQSCMNKHIITRKIVKVRRVMTQYYYRGVHIKKKKKKLSVMIEGWLHPN